MLTIRAQHLIRQLQEGDCSGSDLAQALHTSRRTVIRDVTTINAEFAEKGIGAITTDNGYHLEVQNTTKFHELLDGFRSEEHVVLFEPGLFIEFQKSSAIPRFTRDCAALVFHPLGAPIC
jgi:predicted DNA-binding transcriptional regulator YafY